METLTAVGMVILIVIGILLIVLLGSALRLLLTIYTIFMGNRKESEDEKGSKLLRFVKSAGVIEIILFIIRNRGRFKR